MDKINSKGTGDRILASAIYILPLLTWIFGPMVFYFEYRKTNSFITFHAIWSGIMVLLATISLMLPQFLALPLQLLILILWAYGFLASIFGTTPILFRAIIAKHSGTAKHSEAKRRH